MSDRYRLLAGVSPGSAVAISHRSALDESRKRGAARAPLSYDGSGRFRIVTIVVAGVSALPAAIAGELRETRSRAFFRGEFSDPDHAKIAVIGLGYVSLPLGSPSCVLASLYLVAILGGVRP